MRNSPALSRWDAAVASYLSSRHALGRAFCKEETVLCHIRAFLACRGAKDLDQPLFDQWRRQFYHLSASTRVIREITIYNFCRYRRRTEPHFFLPDRFALARRRPYAPPTLIEHHQVVQLLRYVSVRRSRLLSPRRPAVLRLAIVLLYTAGLRRGELVRLTLDDVDVCGGVLRIRESKFHKSRWVPLSRSAARELRRYLDVRRAIDAHPSPCAPLLCTASGEPYSLTGLSNCVKDAMIRSGIWSGAKRRHGFTIFATASPSPHSRAGTKPTLTCSRTCRGSLCTWVTSRSCRRPITFA